MLAPHAQPRPAEAIGFLLKESPQVESWSWQAL